MNSIEMRLSQGSLLAAALGVFEKKGYAASRVEDILEAAGIARRTFYRHFKSKDDVLASLYGVAMGEILTAMRGASDDDEPLRGVHRAIDVYLDYHIENASTLRVLLGQAVRSDSPLYAMRRTFRSALVKILTDVARTRKKDFHPLVFVSLISALEGVSLEVLETGAHPRDLEVARRTAHTLLTTVFAASRDFPKS